MKAKQTAVEYLVDQLFPKALSIEQYHHIEEAKEKEKQQIIDAYYYDPNCNQIKDDGEQYYKETYEQ
jgi:hypothetical protein